MDTDYADDMAVMDNTEGGLQESTDLIAHYSSVNVRPSDFTPKETLLTIIELTAEGKPVTLSVALSIWVPTLVGMELSTENRDLHIWIQRANGSVQLPSALEDME